MPEATVLYFVTAVVIIGLILWVAAVLRTAKEPWAREAPARVVELASEEPKPHQAEADEADGDAKLADVKKDEEKLDADATARATPVALASEGKTRSAVNMASKDDEKSDKKADV